MRQYHALVMELAFLRTTVHVIQDIPGQNVNWLFAMDMMNLTPMCALPMETALLQTLVNAILDLTD